VPFVIEYNDNEQVDLAEAIDLLDELGFDPADDENLATASIALRRLANNREGISCARTSGLQKAIRPLSRVELRHLSTASRTITISTF